jgi:hypothetical protein
MSLIVYSGVYDPSTHKYKPTFVFPKVGWVQRSV